MSRSGGGEKKVFTMTKIDIVSGFLGAGKTTLIKKLLAEAFQGEKLVLIENEFGEISIDGGFLKDSGVQISEMSSGCICCSLVGDFNKALKEVHEQFHPDRILIEPSGVGKLSDVIVAVENTVKDVPEMKLNSFVTVADATKVKVYMKNFGEFYNNQIEAAGTIILSRTQKLSQEKLEAAAAMLREKNPDAAILTTPWDELDGKTILSAIERVSLSDELLEKMRREHEIEEAEHEHEHHHHHDEHDEHDHEHEHEHHHDHDEDEHDHECCHHDHDEDEDDGEEIEYDEHIWTSPVTAMALCRAICDTLCEADPDNADGYRARLKDYLDELQALDHTFRDIVDGAARRLVVFGDRFPLLYFCKEYDLDYRAAFHGCAGDTEPSLATLKYLIDLAGAEDIPVVYTIELSSQKVANAIAETTGAQVRTFHSCQTVSRAEFDGGATYISLMTANAAVLKEGLS